MLRRLQKMFCTILLVTLLASSSAPAMAKSVTAKVSSSSAKVYKKASKSSKKLKLKKGTKVSVTAVSGNWAKVKKNGKTGYIPTKYLSKGSSSSSKSASRSKSTGSSKSASKSKSTSKSSGSWKSKVVKMNWYNGGSNVLRKGKYGYIYDIDTGVSLKIKRMGGHNHADVEPASATDTAKLLRVAKGKFSWDSHAVILSANGKYVACGINTLPHGDQTIHNNNYNGQFCLHMTGSKTHGSDKENSEHQKSINRAYNWARK